MTINDAVLSCGHQSAGHNAAVAGFDREGNKCVRHMVLCSDCLELERQYGNLLCSDEEILTWLRSKMEKTNALRLADDVELNHKYCPIEVLHEAAAELRRLHAQRDALLEALRKIGRYTGEGPTNFPWQDIVAYLGQTARAAIAAVEETK
jgi:hypothetical protein